MSMEAPTPDPPSQPQPSKRTLDALYVINRHAKQYAKQGTENYEKGNKTTAKAKSTKKRGLYNLKEQVLKELLPAAGRIDVHVINGQEYYCLQFNNYYFHMPDEATNIDDDRIGERKPLNGFTMDTMKEHSNTSLKDALLHLEDTFDINANNLLPSEYIWDGNTRRFIGWRYLGDS